MFRRLLFVATLLILSFAVLQAQEPNARVIHMWEKLNLRSTPTASGAVVTELTGQTSLFVHGKTRDNRWYQVQTMDGSNGWVAAGYVELYATDQSEIPIIIEPAASAPAAEPEAPAAEAVSVEAVAEGRITAGTLNIRSAPTMLGEVVARLPLNTTVNISGRSANSLWYFIQLSDGGSGWAAAAYVTTQNRADIPVVDAIAVQSDNADGASTVEQDSTPAQANPYLRLGSNTWSIFADGQARGNHPDVFSKIGDSITAASVMYAPIGYGAYNLGSYGYLQSTIEFFSQTPTRTSNNSFSSISLSAQNGWTTRSVLNPPRNPSSACAYNEAPLQCEYRVNRPSVALIMLGTNDIAFVPQDEYAHNMRMIIEQTIAEGIIPVVSTIPPRQNYGAEVAFANQVITQLANEYGIPLWDFEAAMHSLPNAGLSDDGVHPTMPPGGVHNAANFTGNYLQYGYVLRNLSALQVLDTLRREVIQR